MAIEAVVFDLGRVLLHWDPEAFYDRVIGEAQRRALFAEVPLHEVNEQIDRGAPFRDSIYRLAEAHPTHATAIRFWHDRWLEIATPAIDGSAVLLRALRAQGVPVYALTNFGAGPLALADQAYPVLKEFDLRFVSGELGILKPEPEIFQVLEEQTGHTGDSLIFVDDKPENIAAAAARGWRTHLFEHAEGWADTLVAEGLLPENPL